MSPRRVEVAVVIFKRGDRLLTVLNKKWKANTFPMTKRRNPDDIENREHWVEAAGRARAEVFRSNVKLNHIPDFDHVVTRTGLRTKSEASYYYQVFWADVDGDPDVEGAPSFKWRTPAEILSSSASAIPPVTLWQRCKIFVAFLASLTGYTSLDDGGPVSPTCVEIVERLRLVAERKSTAVIDVLS